MEKYDAIKQNITQVVLIVFSVVLGLYLSERIEEGKKKKVSANLLAKIKLEVSNNIKIMENWGLYHQTINKNLDSLSKNEIFIEEFVNDKSILLEKLMTRGTFMGISPVNDAWDIAKSHPLIVNIDYDKMVILSRIYKQQEMTFEPGYEMFELYKSKNVNIEKDAKSNLESMSGSMHELVARELQLMEYYNKGKGILGLQDNMGVDN